MAEGTPEPTGLRASLGWSQGGRDCRLELDLPSRGITALFGPSGAGKSSSLRVLAGLERGAEGRLQRGEATWQDSARGLFVPPHRRRIGLVFQESSLFEHLSVAGNLAFGYRRAGRPGSVDRDSLIDRFGVRPLLGRPVAGLSGGERQRVALVRALLTDPALLLLDEPLAAIDASARLGLLEALESLRTELAIPIVLVSHAVEEVARLADWLVPISEGRTRGQGPPAQMLARADLAPVLGEAIGAVVEGTVCSHDARDALTELACAGGTLWLPRRTAVAGQRLRCRIGARDVVLLRQPAAGSSALNQWAATVLEMTPADHPAQCLVRLDANGCVLLARITRRSWQALQLAPGMRVWAQVKAIALGD